MKKIILLIRILLLFSVAFSVFLYWSWREDSAQIREIAQGLSFDMDDQVLLGETIEKLNQRIYANKGFKKNKKYFLFKKLGATPLQILDNGGDCADKSRLIAAVLDEYDVNATLVMLKPCETCMWSHTVVEARKEDNFRMVVDPVYNISFPDGNGAYFGVEPLRNDPKILENRLEKLVKARGENSKIAFYSSSDDGSHYQYAVTINFDKNKMTRTLASMLQLVVDRPSMVLRPRVLEDPKLFLFMFTLCFVFFLSLLYMFILFFVSKKKSCD